MNLLATTAEVANTTYLWLYVILAIVAIVTAVYGLGRWNRKQGVRDSKIDELIDPETGVMAQLAEIKKNLKPNGLNTQGVGDIVARTERDLGKLNTKLDQHIGAELEARQQMQRQIDGKQDKEAA